eukprot:8486841-Alexandrium_andersonii.AAC.1
MFPSDSLDAFRRAVEHTCARACIRDPVQRTACGPPLWSVCPRAFGHQRDSACVGHCPGHRCRRLLVSGGW